MVQHGLYEISISRARSGIASSRRKRKTNKRQGRSEEWLSREGGETFAILREYPKEGRREEVQPLPYEISLEIVYQTWMRDGSSYICSTLRKDNNRKRVVLGEIKKIMFQNMRGGNILLFHPTISYSIVYIFMSIRSLLIVFNFYNNVPITEYVFCCL